MAFETTYKMLMESEGLKRRMVAAAAAAGQSDAPMWVEQNKWAMLPLMVEPSGQHWWQVWEYAENTITISQDIKDIGAKEDVIVDAWIAQTIQSFIDQQAEEAPGNPGGMTPMGRGA